MADSKNDLDTIALDTIAKTRFEASAKAMAAVRTGKPDEALAWLEVVRRADELMPGAVE